MSILCGRALRGGGESIGFAGTGVAGARMKDRGGDQTDMGGSGRAFEATRWTVIEQIKSASEAERRALTGDIVVSYWKPIYCYLRRKGYDNERAKDITQGFFEKVVLGRGLVERAERGRGRFRTLLLTALDHYVSNVREAEGAQKRRPKEGVISLAELDEGHVRLPGDAMGPEGAFAYAWASAVLDEVLAEVRSGCGREGKGAHWLVFEARVLKPIMEGCEPEALASLCERLGIDGEGRASNMVVTVKRRFKAAMVRRIGRYAGCEEDVRREIVDLMEILSKGGAG